mmetsp:Transcript_30709/g.74145  ORF Transcript_30709/g.74145 Transcript_30709/m.74145 type:complete len:490 (+) Transcript_30709:115-1584(+)
MMAGSTAKRPYQGACDAADDRDEGTAASVGNIIRRRLLLSSSSRSPRNRNSRTQIAERNDNEPAAAENARTRSAASVIPAVAIGALAYYAGYLHGKVERYHSEFNNDDIRSNVNDLHMMGGGVVAPGSRRIIDDEDGMLSTVTTMRCLTTPGCYPKVPCEKRKRRPTKVPISHHWKEHSFCAHDLVMPSDNTGNNANHDDDDGTPPCTVYSFGVNDSVEWEARMAATFGCEVFAFDPTSKLGSTPAPGVRFYKLGLRGIGEVDDRLLAANAKYGAIDPDSLLTLMEIIDTLGHQHRSIDVLRLDCEGCEHTALYEFACGQNFYAVKQLMVEFHFQKDMGLGTDADLFMGGDAIKCLEKGRWGLVSLERSGIAPADARYIDSALGVIRDPYFALYATFRRIPLTEKLPPEAYKDVMDASWTKELLYKRYTPKYGTDIYGAWPKRGIVEWNRTEGIFTSKMNEYNSLYSRSLTFDTFQMYGEGGAAKVRGG